MWTTELRLLGQSFENQRHGLTALFPFTSQFRSIAAEFPVKDPTNAFRFEMDNAIFLRERGDRNSSVPLVEADHHAFRFPGNRICDFKTQTEFYDGRCL